MTIDQTTTLVTDLLFLLLACMGFCAGISAGLPAPIDRTKVDVSKLDFIGRIVATRAYGYWYRMVNAMGCNWGKARNFADPKQLAVINMAIKTAIGLIASLKTIQSVGDTASPTAANATDTPTTVVPEVTYVTPTNTPVVTIPDVTQK